MMWHDPQNSGLLVARSAITSPITHSKTRTTTVIARPLSRRTAKWRLRVPGEVAGNGSPWDPGEADGFSSGIENHSRNKDLPQSGLPTPPKGMELHACSFSPQGDRAKGALLRILGMLLVRSRQMARHAHVLGLHEVNRAADVSFFILGKLLLAECFGDFGVLTS